MRSWLTYGGAFACGVGAAFGAYLLAVTFVMSIAMSISVAGFVGLVILVPVLVGGFVFGFVYPRLSGVQFTGSDWLNGAAFTLGITIVCSSLILSRALQELPALVLLLGLLFAGGRVLVTRRSHD